LEFQQRGAPHFHPFVWGLKDDQFRDFLLWISDVWNEIAGDRDQDHFLAGTRVEKMRSPAAAVRYVSGYASKADQTLPGQKVGRYWGIVGRNNIPWGEPETLQLNSTEAKFVMRTCRRYIAAVNRETRIRIVAKRVKLRPWELTSFGGWFCRSRRPLDWGKHLRASGGRMPQKLRLRNLKSLNVFLTADFWADKIRSVVGVPKPLTRTR
jgi:hypothetical protein